MMIGRFIAILKKRKVAMIVTVTVLFFVCEGFFRTLLPVYAQETLFLTPSVIGILFALFGGLNALVRIPGGKLSDSVGRKKPLILSFVLSALAFMIFSGAAQFTLLILGMAVYGVAWGTRVPTSSALMGDSVGRDELSIAIAYVWMAADLGFSIGAALAGSLGSIVSFPYILQSLAVLCIVSAVLILFGFRDIK
jgi:MFS family permease